MPSRPLTEPLEPRRLFAVDLVVRSVVPDVSSVEAGGVITGTLTVANEGETFTSTGDTPGTVAAYVVLTRNRIAPGVRPGFAGRSVRVELPIPLAGEAASVKFSLPVAKAQPAGSFSVSAIASLVVSDTDPFLSGTDLTGSDPTPANNGLSSDATLAVLRPAPRVGTPDPAFGTAGSATSRIFGPRMDVVGTAFDPGTGLQYLAGTRTTSGVSRVALVRLTAAGAADPTFGDNNDGSLFIAGAPDAVARAIARADDGSLLVAAAAQADNSMVLARFRPDGSPDNTFGTAGVLVVPVTTLAALSISSLSRVLPAPGGNVYVVGTVGTLNSQRLALLRVTSTGIDTTFGNAGVAVAPAAQPNGTDTPRAATILPDGRVAVVGGSRNVAGTRALVAVFNPDGSAYTPVNKTGVTLLPASSPSDTLTSVALSTDGKSLIVGGLSRTLPPDAPDGSRPLVARVSLSTGAPDRAFDRDGIALLPQPAALSGVSALSPTPDGGVLASVRTAVDTTAISSRRVGLTLVRLDAKGQPLAAFGTAGVLEVTPAPVQPAATVEEDLDALADSRAGFVEMLPGGRLRVLVNDISTPGITTFNATQLVADGVDLELSTTSVVSGAALVGKSRTMVVTVSNRGTLTSRGPSTLAVRLLTDPDEPDGVIASVTSPSFTLAPGGSRRFTVRFNLPSVEARQNFFLAVDATAPIATPDINAANNRVAADGTLLLGNAFTDLRFSAPILPTTPALTPGRSLTLRIPVTNFGNSAPVGTATATLLLADAPDDPAPLTLATAPLRVAARPDGIASTLSIRFLLPRDLPALPPGKHLLLRLEGAALSLDITPADNLAFSTSPVT